MEPQVGVSCAASYVLVFWIRATTIHESILSGFHVSQIPSLLRCIVRSSRLRDVSRDYESGKRSALGSPGIGPEAHVFASPHSRICDIVAEIQTQCF